MKNSLKKFPCSISRSSHKSMRLILFPLYHDTPYCFRSALSCITVFSFHESWLPRHFPTDLQFSLSMNHDCLDIFRPTPLYAYRFLSKFSLLSLVPYSVLLICILSVLWWPYDFPSQFSLYLNFLRDRQSFTVFSFSVLFLCHDWLTIFQFTVAIFHIDLSLTFPIFQLTPLYAHSSFPDFLWVTLPSPLSLNLLWSWLLYTRYTDR
jgi:hypothetical protein